MKFCFHIYFHIFSIFFVFMESPPDNVGEGIMFFGLSVHRVRLFVRPFIRLDTDSSCYHDIS